MAKIRKDSEGRLHFKLVYWGPSLGGKTTSLRYVYDDVEGLDKGGFTSIEDPSGRTLFFDFVPMSASGKILFDVYTVAGQTRHKHQRKVIMRGADGVLFVADSSRSMKQDNIDSLQELKDIVGDVLGDQIPLVIALNKRDVDDAMSREEILKDLSLENSSIPVYETIAVKGIGVKRAFQTLSREVLLKQLYGIKTAH